MNRKFFQPGECALETFEGIVLELEAVRDCDSVEEVYERLEEREVVFRVDSDRREESPVSSEPVAADPFDFLRAIVLGIKTELGWQDSDIRAWVDASRLNLVGGLIHHADQNAVRALQSRFLAALFPALDNLEQLAAHASDAERARIFEPEDA